MRSIYISLFAAVILMCAGKVMAVEMPDLAKKNRCSACHAIDKKIVGPAWMDVSKFYNGKMEKTTNGKTLKEATGARLQLIGCSTKFLMVAREIGEQRLWICQTIQSARDRKK